MNSPRTARFPTPLPSSMGRDAFIARFGGVYEHSPWVAERTFDRGPGPEADTAEGLAALMADTMRAASREEQMALIRAHPDLAGKADLILVAVKNMHLEAIAPLLSASARS